jgi:hypothetical protein
MIYKYDKRSMQFKNITAKFSGMLSILIGVIINVSIVLTAIHYQKNAVLVLNEEERLIVINEHAKFTEEKLIRKLQSLNIKFPHIVYAQAIIETGNFSSKVFKENNNLFGMREAKQRITTARGTENNHAYYHSWHESVLDYAFYQCRYLSSVRTEEQYFEYLSQSYAEDPEYITKIKNIIRTQNIISKFN